MESFVKLQGGTFRTSQKQFSSPEWGGVQVGLANPSESSGLCPIYSGPGSCGWAGAALLGAIHPTSALLNPSCPDSPSAHGSGQVPERGIQALG